MDNTEIMEDFFSDVDFDTITTDNDALAFHKGSLASVLKGELRLSESEVDYFFKLNEDDHETLTRKLVEFNHKKINELLLSNQNLPTHVLSEIWNENSDNITDDLLFSLAVHKNSDEKTVMDVVTKLDTNFIGKVSNNMLLLDTLIEVKHSSVLEKFYFKYFFESSVVSYIMSNTRFVTQTIFNDCRDNFQHKNIIPYMLDYPLITDADFEKLSELDDLSFDALTVFFQNPKTPNMVLHSLFRKYSIWFNGAEDLMVAFLKHKNVGEDFLQRYSKSKNVKYRIAVASNKTTPVKVLRELVVDMDGRVRLKVFNNISKPEELNDIFASDAIPQIRFNAIRSKKCSKRTLMKALDDDDAQVRLAALFFVSKFPEFKEWPVEWLLARYDVQKEYDIFYVKEMVFDWDNDLFHYLEGK